MNKDVMEQLRNDIITWLDKMSAGLEPGRFRYCSKGSLMPTTGPQAQMPTCFAMKIAWQIGLWDTWEKEKRDACVDFIKSFQKPDGYFYDPWLAKSAKIRLKEYILLLLGRISWQPLKERPIENIRAETRQSASTLLMVGEAPKYPMPQEINTVDEAVEFVHGLDWRNPWGGGSHFSHQLFMLTVNGEYFDKPKNKEIIEAMLDALSKYHDPKTGTWWSVQNTSDYYKINGAMKIYSGLQWLPNPYSESKVLLDYALEQPFEEDGCGVLNRLFVVYQAHLSCPENYRKKEIKELAEKALVEFLKFRGTDGAFSFFMNAAQKSYYGARVSRGENVSDIHGTTMFVWAIAITLELLGQNAKSGQSLWTPHKA